MEDQTNNPISIAPVTECHRISNQSEGNQILLCSSSSDDKENERSSLKRKSHKKKRKSKERNDDNEKSSRKKPKKSSKNKRRRSKSSKSSTTLTSNAIESLIKFSHASSKDKTANLSLEDSQLIVRLRLEGDPSRLLLLPEEDGDEVYDRTLLATISDGTHTLKVLLLQDPTNLRLQRHLADASSDKGNNNDRNSSNVKDWIVGIRALVTTEGYNPKYHLESIVCLTSIEVLSVVDASAEPFPTTRPYKFPPKPMAAVPQSPVPSSISMAPTNSNSPSRLVAASATSTSTAKVRAGRIGTFLDQTLPYCTNEELAYCNDTAALRILLAQESRDYIENNNNASCSSPARNTTTTSTNTNNTNAPPPSPSTATASTPTSAVDTVLSRTHKHAENVQTFMTRHTAMMTLQGSAQPTTDHGVPSYTSALNEFATSQLDRQTTSLSTNAGREAADRATLITTQHNTALREALQPARRPRSNSAAGIPPLPPQLLVAEDKKSEDSSLAPGSSSNNESISGSTNPTPVSTSSTTIYCFSTLTPERLKQWHSTLLEGLHPEAGKIRTKTVRAGHTVFCRPKEIESELDKFCTSLASLQHRLDLCSNVWHAVLFAAIAMYGVVDIHPFMDGNGRMSRIVANWALQQFPFSINLFATPAQRAEYVVALESTRHLLSMAKTSGNVSRDEKLDVIKSVGVFAPVMRLLMDRLGRAVIEFNRVWEEKSGLAAEAMECKAARLARERAKEGTCIICLDEGPNIATLCCGKAVHLNCIAEWLSAKNSCPCCRSELPSISGRVVRAARQERLGEPGMTDSPSGQMRSGGRHRYIFDRERQTARDVIVSLLNNFHHTTTETAEEGYDSAHDTTAADIQDPVDEEALDTSSEDDNSSDSDDDSDDSDDNGMMVLARTRMFSQSSSSSSSDDDSDDDDDDENDNDAILANAAAVLRRRLNNQDEDTEGNSSSVVSESDSFSRREEGSREARNSENEHIATTSTLDGAEDETMEGGSSSVQMYCCALYCRNRPAVDCTNNLCGRCCVLGGEFHCPRHNS